jgi:hypothetical protein
VGTLLRVESRGTTRRSTTGGKGSGTGSSLSVPGGSQGLTSQAEHLHLQHLWHQEPVIIFFNKEHGQDDSANPAALSAPKPGASQTLPPSSLPFAPQAKPSTTSSSSSPGELKQTKLRKLETARRSKISGRTLPTRQERSKMTGREDLPCHLRHQKLQHVCKPEESLVKEVNYLLGPELEAWLEPHGPPPLSSSSGLSGTSSGQHYQPGMTRGKGFSSFCQGAGTPVV